MNDHANGPTQVSPDRASAQSPQAASFEEGLSQLAEIVGRLEGGQLGLAESIAAYERGVSLVRTLHGELAAVEQRVRVLTAAADGRGGEGINHGNEPVDEDASPLAFEGPASIAKTGPPSRGGRSAGGRKGAKKVSVTPTAGSAADLPRSLPGMDDPSAEV
jgi:exodeoxyribonuclease VII small subunit